MIDLRFEANLRWLEWIFRGESDLNSESALVVWWIVLKKQKHAMSHRTRINSSAIVKTMTKEIVFCFLTYRAHQARPNQDVSIVDLE